MSPEGEVLAAAERARRSLDGLSVGDAFGEAALHLDADSDELPQGPWQWTDDTHMATSVVEILEEHGEIEPDELAERCGERFAEQPWRGYGPGAATILSNIARGGDWRKLAPEMFDGEGSFGNGGAMRAAPIGAWFADQPERAAEQARTAAAITHAHRDGKEGAAAVAAAAALITPAGESEGVVPSPDQIFVGVLGQLRRSRVRDRIEEAAGLEGTYVSGAADHLGCGERITAQDTVPFCLWVASRFADSYEIALRSTAAVGGDRDTNCAIVGGIIGVISPPPEEWLRRREPLQYS